MDCGATCFLFLHFFINWRRVKKSVWSCSPSILCHTNKHRVVPPAGFSFHSLPFSFLLPSLSALFTLLITSCASLQERHCFILGTNFMSCSRKGILFGASWFSVTQSMDVTWLRNAMHRPEWKGIKSKKKSDSVRVSLECSLAFAGAVCQMSFFLLSGFQHTSPTAWRIGY